MPISGKEGNEQEAELNSPSLKVFTSFLVGGEGIALKNAGGGGGGFNSLKPLDQSCSQSPCNPSQKKNQRDGKYPSRNPDHPRKEIPQKKKKKEGKKKNPKKRGTLNQQKPMKKVKHF